MNLEKTTEELLETLQNEENIENYLSENDTELLNISLSEYLTQLLEKYNISRNEAVNKSKLSQIYGYQLFSGERANPSRNKVIQIIFGIGLNIKDAQRLLRLTGASELYSRNKRDSIIIFALNKGLNISQCDDLLFELKEETVIEQK